VRIAVFCGSSRRVGEPHTSAARELGDAIARRGHTMVYGGGRTGLMGAAADAALAAGGEVHGVIYDAFVEQGVHHTGLTVLHLTRDMRSRKAGLDERADAFVALPGGLGTLEELAEILSFRKLGLHRRPLVLVDTEGFYAPLLALLERFVADGFDAPGIRDYWRVTGEARRAVSLCEELCAP
jgi:uncharacterized protein (TIGR00730 family)